ncbi:MAG: hypothetical protein KJ666_01080 [Bacteroidetes bacterium]|nr:hypothetical protein [Bacteroidota bacterium]MBU2585799.1 hypothetical protein [Bacteroidota bacterium]
MKTNDIIKEITRLPINRRIFIVEQTLKYIRVKEEKNNIKKAVNALLNDYSTDKKLTEFTDIDFEEFYEAR